MFVCLSLSLNSLIPVLSCFYSLLIKTTGWIAKTTGWFFGNQLNQFCSLASLISFSVIHHWISLYLQSLRKSFINSSSPFLFKAINSNNWHQELSSWKIFKLIKSSELMADKLPFGEGTSINRPPLFYKKTF